MCKRTVLMAGAVMITAFLLVLSIPGTAPGAVGDVVRTFPVVDYDWGGGGVTYHDGHIYTRARRSNYIHKRDMVSGEVLDSIYISQQWAATLTWDSTRQTWWVTDPFDYSHGTADCFQYPAEGGNYISSFEPGLYETGIFYDASIDRLWIAGHINGYFASYTVDGQQGDRIYPGFNVAGIARVGDHFWVGNHTDGSYGTFIRKVNMDGSSTGIQFTLPWSGYDGYIQANDLTFDGKYLWARGQNPRTASSQIYQIDIGFTTPSPSPTPTPASLVLDSGDYDGDSTSDIAVFRQSSGMWAIKGVTRDYFGSGAIPASGDFNGDGTTDLAVFRSGLWAVKGITRTYFGGSSDIPVPGDYDADGTCDAGIYRSGLWAVRGITRAYFGAGADLPAPVYGSGRALPKDMGIFRPGSGLWAIRGLTRTYFGASLDQPVPANYSETPDMVNVAIFRPSQAGLWAVRGETRFYFGAADDRPVPGNYTGFIPANAGIFRPSSGLWAIRGVTRAYFGGSSDLPVSGLAINPSSAIIP